MKDTLQIIATLHPAVTIDVLRLGVALSTDESLLKYGSLDQRLAIANFFVQMFNEDNTRGEHYILAVGDDE